MPVRSEVEGRREERAGRAMFSPSSAAQESRGIEWLVPPGPPEQPASLAMLSGDAGGNLGGSPRYCQAWRVWALRRTAPSRAPVRHLQAGESYSVHVSRMAQTFPSTEPRAQSFPASRPKITVFRGRHSIC